MSVVVDLSVLAEHLEDFGSVAYLVSVAENGLPHVVAVSPEVGGGRIRTGTGRRTAGNLAARPAVTLLWPAPPGTGYGLIVDGEAHVHPEGDGTGGTLEIRPTGAVLHRTPEGDASAPSCVTVLPSG